MYEKSFVFSQFYQVKRPKHNFTHKKDTLFPQNLLDVVPQRDNSVRNLEATKPLRSKCQNLPLVTDINCNYFHSLSQQNFIRFKIYSKKQFITHLTAPIERSVSGHHTNIAPRNALPAANELPPIATAVASKLQLSIRQYHPPEEQLLCERSFSLKDAPNDAVPMKHSLPRGTLRGSNVRFI